MRTDLHALPDYEPIEVNPNSNANVALITRVAERVAIGIPLQYAVAGEGLSPEEYEQQLREHPDLQATHDVTIREFLEDCIRALLAAKNPGPNIRWLLERLYPEIFGKQRSNALSPVALQRFNDLTI